MKSLNSLQPLGLVVLRVALGLIFFSHGYPKLAHSGAGMQGFFVQHGLPGYFVYISGVMEVFGARATGSGIVYAGDGIASGYRNGRGNLEGPQRRRLSCRAQLRIPSRDAGGKLRARDRGRGIIVSRSPFVRRRPRQFAASQKFEASEVTISNCKTPRNASPSGRCDQRQFDETCLTRRAIDALGRLAIVTRLRPENIRNESLRIAVV